MLPGLLEEVAVAVLVGVAQGSVAVADCWAAGIQIPAKEFVGVVAKRRLFGMLLG